MTLKRLAIVCVLICAATQAQQSKASSPVADAQVEAMPTVQLTGIVHSRNEVRMTAGIEGLLEFVAEPGTQVVPNELLVRFDQQQLDLQRAEQEAILQRIQAQLSYLDTQLQRQLDLRSRNQVAASDLEYARAKRDMAASELRIADLRIQQIDDRLRRSELRSKFAGVVTERLHRAGETITRGTIIGRLTDLEHLEVRVLIPIQYFSRVISGDRLQMSSYGSRFEGLVRTIVPPVTNQTFELRINMRGLSGFPKRFFIEEPSS